MQSSGSRQIWPWSWDGLDVDCDGAIDIAWCDKPLVDSDNDDVPDGLDLDCDGTVGSLDYRF